MTHALWVVLPMLYALFIGAHTWGWYRVARRKAPQAATNSVALIVPARNEAHAVQLNLPQWRALTYPGLQLVLVDDHSDDATLRHLQAAAPPALVITAEGTGKKAALHTGIRASNSRWMVTTDADCRPAHPDWLQSLLGYASPEAVCLVGPLRKTHGGTLFEKIQALESAGLVGLAGGAIGLGAPTLANGANLAFRRDAFEVVGGYQGIDQVASGDDELLVHKLAQGFGPRSIRFVADPLAIVDTPAEQRWTDLHRQRIRWVSKSRAYTNPFIRWGQMLAYVAYLSLLLLTLRLAWAPESWPWAALAWGTKLLAELSLLYPATRLLGQRYLLWLLPFYQLPYLLYVLYIGIAGSLAKTYQWKGRRVR